MELHQFFEVPAALTADLASQVRTAVTLAPIRKDYLERALFSKPPAWRMCTLKFRQEGLLLPYGSYRGAFDTPNP